MPYQTTKPAPNDNLDVSVTDIQQNFLVANTIMNIDHFPFDDLTASKGFHKQAHLVAASDPAAVAGTDIIYSKNYTPDTTGATTDTQLFNRTALGGISQLTGNLAVQEGYVWSGGMLFQWGKVTTASSGSFASGQAGGTVTFKDRVAGAIPFPNNLFVVIPVPIWTAGGTPNSAGSSNIDTDPANFLRTSFRWAFNSSSGSYIGFFWVAIGN